MWLNEFTQIIIREIFEFNEGKKTTEQAFFNINKAIDEFSERVTDRDDIARYARRFIRKHFSPIFPNTKTVADALTSGSENRSVHHLVNLCKEIGSVADSDAGFVCGLSLVLACSPVEEMTVAELLDTIRKCRASYNEYQNKAEVAG